jgi:RNA polymerase sigma-B factor
MRRVRGHEDELFARVREHSDSDASAKLVQRYMPLARSMARRYDHTSEPLEDLTQIACVGLVKAIQGFEPERGFAFTSYAVPKILGEIRRHLRDKSWALHVPRSAQERALAVSRETKRLEAELGHRPSRRELADQLGWSVEEVSQGQQAAEAYATTPLDQRLRQHRELPDPPTVADVIGDDDGGYEIAEARATMVPAWKRMGERNRRLLRLRFAHDMTQREISEQLGCSQVHVSRMLRRALDELAVAAGAAGLA